MEEQKHWETIDIREEAAREMAPKEEEQRNPADSAGSVLKPNRVVIAVLVVLVVCLALGLGLGLGLNEDDNKDSPSWLPQCVNDSIALLDSSQELVLAVEGILEESDMPCVFKVDVNEDGSYAYDIPCFVQWRGLDYFAAACETAGGRFVASEFFSLFDEIDDATKNIYCQVRRLHDTFPVIGFYVDSVFLCAAPSCTPAQDYYISEVDNKKWMDEDLMEAAISVFMHIEDMGEEIKQCSVLDSGRLPDSVQKPIDACREKYKPTRTTLCEATEYLCAFEHSFFEVEEGNATVSEGSDAAPEPDVEVVDDEREIPPVVVQREGSCGEYCASCGGTCLYHGGYDDDCSLRDDRRGSCDATFSDDICVCRM